MPPIVGATGFEFRPVEGFDTDAFGSFDGRVPRPGTVRDAATAKARAGAALAGTPIAVASEGAYGPHPTVPFARGGMECVVLVDVERDLVVAEHRVIHRPVFVSVSLDRGGDIGAVLEEAHFPSHAVMVGVDRAEESTEWIGKGIRERDLLENLVDAIWRSGEARVRIASDMRADRNPTRMRDIAEVAHALAERMACHCPECGTPGFGWEDHLRGLPCEACGHPTPLVRGEVHGCSGCSHREERPRADRLTRADMAACPRCHP